MDYSIQSIKRSDYTNWLLHKHYAKRIPPVTYAFGLYNNEKILKGVLTVGKPPSKDLCVGVCGCENHHYVQELNRLCIEEGLEKNLLSWFVSRCLKLLPTMILVSYADSSMNHHGYIYQATNFIYTGLSAKRGEWRVIGLNKHSRTIFSRKEELRKIYGDRVQMVERPRKHRYIYFIGSKTQKKKWNKDLRYGILPYPKGDNKRYDASFSPKTQGLLF